MTTRTDTALVLIDVQGKLAEIVHNHEELHANLEKIVLCMRALNVPVICAEQNPERMGPTIPRVARHLEDVKPIPKMEFSCTGSHVFMGALEETQCKRVVLCGIETHVCVYQTAVGLLNQGYAVEIAADCVSSRSELNRDIGLKRIQAEGGTLTSTEMLTFELMGTAEHQAFRDILKIIR